MNNFENVDNYLEHVGKKGMRWGVRTGSKKGSGAKKQYTLKPKTRSQEIKEARSNVKTKLKEVNALGDKAANAKTVKTAKAYDNKANTKMSELLKSKDYKMSKQLTSGQQYARIALKGGILLTAIGLSSGAAYKAK